MENSEKPKQTLEQQKPELMAFITKMKSLPDEELQRVYVHLNSEVMERNRKHLGLSNPRISQENI